MSRHNRRRRTRTRRTAARAAAFIRAFERWATATFGPVELLPSVVMTPIVTPGRAQAIALPKHRRFVVTAAVYFFGAWAPDNIGHFLYLQSGRHAVGTIDHVVTQAMLALCPARCGHYDSMLPPQFPDHVTYEPDQPTDVGAVHHTGRYSVLAWWDRGGDNRRNSNSAIIVEADEPLNFDGLILVALAKFPHLTARLPAREYTA